MRLGVTLVLVSLICAGPVAAQQFSCPTQRTIVDIPGSPDAAKRACWRNVFVSAATTPNTTVRLRSDVVFNFSDFTKFPIQLGRCVTVMSVRSFDKPPLDCNPAGISGSAAATVARFGRSGPAPEASAKVTPPPDSTSARTAHSLGPTLWIGKHDDPKNPLPDTEAFFQTTCTADGAVDNDGVKMSGFRLIGPTLQDQTTDQEGLRVEGCLHVEVSNMEIAGWGGAGVEFRNKNIPGIPDTEPRAIETLLHDSYIHDNKHPTEGGTLCIGGHAAGYGVTTGQGGWSRIYNNAFDNNRHDIASAGTAGGYFADHNFALKGGGYHGSPCEKYTQIFDVHGTGDNGLGGEAGRHFGFHENVLQYTRTSDIHIRGEPRGVATIDHNIFARSDEDAAIDLYTENHVDVKPNNAYNVDGYGQYDVCDFDGDGYDDLFSANGLTWWFAGRAKFQWTYLQADQLPRAELRFGYFDDDLKCDVLAELPIGSGQWFISSGGVTDPFATRLGGPTANFGHPLSEVRFGRFDPNIRDHRHGVTLPTTHAFWRRADGQWFVTPLTDPQGWVPVESSGFALSKLRFGDFTGDGVTDVLAVEDGHWAISESAAKPWRRLNATLNDPVENLFIANMDTDDNIDDILRLDRKITVKTINGVLTDVVQVTWQRSRNGTGPWKVWKTYTYQYKHGDDTFVPAGYGFVGRFSPLARNGATLVIDQNRRGHFFASGTPAEASLFQY